MWHQTDEESVPVRAADTAIEASWSGERLPESDFVCGGVLHLFPPRDIVPTA